MNSEIKKWKEERGVKDIILCRNTGKFYYKYWLNDIPEWINLTIDEKLDFVCNITMIFGYDKIEEGLYFVIFRAKNIEEKFKEWREKRNESN